ncbi:SDR family oxidoreductase [Loigolactobacillus binensis]|uniref:SDR family oxidoreductase n=1 Tax=Loigolactobacillus binensis TaxID=2559922 RepID=A0ABW3E8X1_9LACO|nr:SDR family oxidoreductase [Loigolactobacillus binensis]
MPQKIAVITGAGQGIGRAIAKVLAADGFFVAASDIIMAAAQRTVSEIHQQHHQAAAYQANVIYQHDLVQLVEQVVAEHGHIDVMVNDAGIVKVGPIEQITNKEVDELLAVNVKGVLFGIQAAAKFMKRQPTGGKIINAAGLGGMEGMPLLSAYSASKFAVRGLTQAAAKELAPYHINVNAYSPGIVASPLWDIVNAQVEKLDQDSRQLALKQFKERIALNRIEQPGDAANLVAFLASDRADYITGQTIAVDGGLHMN